MHNHESGVQFGFLSPCLREVSKDCLLCFKLSKNHILGLPTHESHSDFYSSLLIGQKVILGTNKHVQRLSRI